MRYINQFSKEIETLISKIADCEKLIIGAGAGLSTSAGFAYSGNRFNKYFYDFAEKYGIRDMYSGGFYPFSDVETRWAWWSRHIWINRYMNAPKPVYEELACLVFNKDYFVITTNVDHQFQKAGFDKNRLFYTQGDYGLWQCSEPCHKKTYDNEAVVRKMLEYQGFIIEADNELTVPDGIELKMEVPCEMVPHCPVCGREMTMNLRADDTFVEDEGWHEASYRYLEFIDETKSKETLYLELGVGANTPVIIKYPFWRFTYQNEKAIYACINYGEAMAPKEIQNRSICINADVGELLKILNR